MSYYNVPVSTASDIHKILDVAMKLMYPVYLHGPVGVGKTSSIEAYAEEHGYHCVVRILTQTQPTDFCIPFLDHSGPETITRWAVADFLKELPTNHPSILVLDEINTAPDDVQTACYSLLQERRIGHFYLPKHCLVVACGNRIQDGALGEALNTAIASRVMHVQIEPDSKSWVNWAVEHEIDSRVIAFIEAKPQYLHKQLLEINQSDDTVAFPSPRAWERVSNLLKVTKDVHAFNILLSGIVGMQTASTFRVTLEELKNLRPVEEYLEMNQTALTKNLPGTITSLYGLAYAALAFANADIDKLIKVCTLMVNITKCKQTKDLPYNEVALMCLQQSVCKLQTVGGTNILLGKHNLLWKEIRELVSHIPKFRELTE